MLGSSRQSHSCGSSTRMAAILDDIAGFLARHYCTIRQHFPYLWPTVWDEVCTLLPKGEASRVITTPWTQTSDGTAAERFDNLQDKTELMVIREVLPVVEGEAEARCSPFLNMLIGHFRGATTSTASRFGRARRVGQWLPGRSQAPALGCPTGERWTILYTCCAGAASCDNMKEVLAELCSRLPQYVLVPAVDREPWPVLLRIRWHKSGDRKLIAQDRGSHTSGNNPMTGCDWSRLMPLVDCKARSSEDVKLSKRARDVYRAPLDAVEEVCVAARGAEAEVYAQVLAALKEAADNGHGEATHTLKLKRGDLPKRVRSRVGSAGVLLAMVCVRADWPQPECH
jgi:hypothetical protein